MRRLIQLGLFASLLTGLLIGCAAFHDKQGQWIFNPTERTWGSGSLTEGERDAYVRFRSDVTQNEVSLHVLVSGEDIASGKSEFTHGSSFKKPVLLYLHGARWNVMSSTWRINRMRELGFVVIAPDYRGFGKSDKEIPSEAKAYEDVRAVWSWMAKEFPERPRFIFGHSLGGAIAVELASQVSDLKGLMIEGSFTSIPDVVASMRWGWLPVKWLISQRFDALSKIKSVKAPILVVHGSEDQTIPNALGRQLYEAAPEPKRWVLVQGGSHHNTNGLGQVHYRLAMSELFGLPKQ